MRHLKLRKIEGSDLSFQNGMLIQSVAGGLSKTRRTIVGSPVITSVELQLNPKEYDQWSYFYRYLINYGADIFTADFIVDTWLVEKQTVQMIGDGPVVSFEGFTAYVSFNIEVLRKRDDKAYLAEIIYSYGDVETACDILTGLQNIGNNKFISANDTRTVYDIVTDDLAANLETVSNNRFVDG